MAHVALTFQTSQNWVIPYGIMRYLNNLSLWIQERSSAQQGQLISYSQHASIPDENCLLPPPDCEGTG